MVKVGFWNPIRCRELLELPVWNLDLPAIPSLLPCETIQHVPPRWVLEPLPKRHSSRRIESTRVAVVVEERINRGVV
jgi:hypothetical protein